MPGLRCTEQELKRFILGLEEHHGRAPQRLSDSGKLQRVETLGSLLDARDRRPLQAQRGSKLFLSQAARPPELAKKYVIAGLPA